MTKGPRAKIIPILLYYVELAKSIRYYTTQGGACTYNLHDGSTWKLLCAEVTFARVPLVYNITQSNEHMHAPHNESTSRTVLSSTDTNMPIYYITHNSAHMHTPHDIFTARSERSYQALTHECQPSLLCKVHHMQGPFCSWNYHVRFRLRPT